jgi:pimeloyl-ACP methyl ester carboxylesterase
MEKRIANLHVDIFPPEFAKFKSPLILVHGLWSDNSCWSEWATHFSNLGWECWSVNLRGRRDKDAAQALRPLTVDDCKQDLTALLRSAPYPPVLLAHSFGGVLAHYAAVEEKASALVLLSPPAPTAGKAAFPKALRLLRLKYFPLLWLRRPFLLQEKDFLQTFLASVVQHRRQNILRRMVPESAHLAWQFLRQDADLGRCDIQCPVLIIVGSDDTVIIPSILRETARRLCAEFLELAHHGHWMMGEEGGEKIVRDIHRWLVRTLGEKILIAEFPNAAP